MLSICIPIFNYEVRNLVRKLQQEAEALGIVYEIWLIDDGSDARFLYQNSLLQVLPNVYYEELSTNIGRSAIRNLLASKAQYDYLVFMDCDAEVPQNDYLAQYVACCKQGAAVVYGGRAYAPAPRKVAWHFRWWYGVQRECPLAAVRQQHPNRSFITFNFLIAKAVFAQVQFDETLRGYGHEDTLFGYALGRKGYTVQHIDNALWHIGLEDSATFIAKTENGIRNLYQLYLALGKPAELVQDIKLLYAFRQIERLHLKGLVGWLFAHYKAALLRNLHGKNPNLRVFDLYKLGFLVVSC